MNKETIDVTKVRLHVMLVLQLYVMLVLSNVTMKLSNARKKKKGIIKCDKSIVTYDIGTA